MAPGFFCLFIYTFYFLSWEASHYTIGRNILRYNCASGNNCIIANGNSLCHNSICTNPYILANSNRCWMKLLSLLWGQVVIQCRKHNTVAY